MHEAGIGQRKQKRTCHVDRSVGCASRVQAGLMNGVYRLVYCEAC